MDYFESISTLNQGNKRFLYVIHMNGKILKNINVYKLESCNLQDWANRIKI